MRNSIFLISDKSGFIPRLSVFYVAYVLLLVLGRLFSVHSHGIVAFWPANGLLLGVMLLSSRKEWPAYIVLVLLTRGLYSAMSGGAFPVGLLLGAGNVIEALVGAVTLRKFFPKTNEFFSVQETLGLIAFGGIGSTIVGATICSLSFNTPTYGDLFLEHWRRYWVGDMLGILFVTPLILAWNYRPPRAEEDFTTRRIAEGTILFFSTVTLSWFVYSGNIRDVDTDFFYLTPLLIWAALRFGPRGVTANGFALAAISIWYFSSTQDAAGIRGDIERRAIDLQMFLGITMSTTLILVAVLADRQKSLQRLIESERYLQSAFATIPDAVALTDAATGRYRDVNEAFCQNTGYRREELIGKTSLEMGIWIDEDDRLGISSQIMLNGKVSLFEARFRRKDGSILVGLMSACVIHIEDEPVIFSITTDITPRKIAEETLERSLREKEVLLREIHHRVKNNLQIVSSLLNLQTTHTQDRHTVNLFHESQARIRSMALIHEHLYRSSSLASINFSEYVKSLTSSLLRSQIHSSRRVALTIDIPDIALDIDTAIPCGLIINELVTNSLKYAFPFDREGRISITMKRDGPSVTLTVSDDGIGLPAGFDARKSSSLGLELVATLSEQIGAKLIVDNAAGAHFCLSWEAKELESPSS